MRLVPLLGTPSVHGSHLRPLIRQLAQGFGMAGGESCEPISLWANDRPARIAEALADADYALVILAIHKGSASPMAGLFADLQLALSRLDHRPALAYVVQSDVAGPVNSCYLDRYLERTTREMDCRYLGTTIHGCHQSALARTGAVDPGLLQAFRSLGRTLGMRNELPYRIQRQLTLAR